MERLEAEGNLARGDPTPGCRHTALQRALHVISGQADLPERRYRRLLAAFVVVFFLFLAAPLIQITLRPFPRAEVPYGLNAPPSRPAFSLKGFGTERYQKKFEGWFSRGNGLWGYLVRVSNQLNYSLFNQVSTHYRTTILAGKEGHLFQPMYLPSFNRKKMARPKKYIKSVRALGRLQRLLAQRGKTMVSLISTNMPALYPELVPDYFTDPTRLSRKNSYEVVRPLYDQFGVNYVDAHEYLSRLVPTAGIRFFEPTASHWNNLGSCLATGALIGKIEGLLGRKMKKFACAPYVLTYPPRGWDLDLVRIANLLFPERTYKPAPQIEPRTLADGDEFKPRILFVGSSFVFSVLNHFKKHEIAEDFTFYFYYRQVRDSSHRQLRALRRQDIDWERDVFSHDVIVLERNMASIGDMGFSFVKDAIKHLRASRPQGRIK